MSLQKIVTARAWYTTIFRHGTRGCVQSFKKSACIQCVFELQVFILEVFKQEKKESRSTKEKVVFSFGRTVTPDWSWEKRTRRNYVSFMFYGVIKSLFCRHCFRNSCLSLCVCAVLERSVFYIWVGYKCWEIGRCQGNTTQNLRDSYL